MLFLVGRKFVCKLNFAKERSIFKDSKKVEIDFETERYSLYFEAPISKLEATQNIAWNKVLKISCQIWIV